MTVKSDMYMIPGKSIMEKEDKEIVLVNINRIYEKMALAMRSISDETERNKVVKVQRKALTKVRTDKEMFVPMTVEDVKIGFGSNLDRLPHNTFRFMKVTEK